MFSRQLGDAKHLKLLQLVTNVVQIKGTKFALISLAVVIYLRSQPQCILRIYPL